MARPSRILPKMTRSTLHSLFAGWAAHTLVQAASRQPVAATLLCRAPWQRRIPRVMLVCHAAGAPASGLRSPRQLSVASACPQEAVSGILACKQKVVLEVGLTSAGTPGSAPAFDLQLQCISR